MASKFSVSVKKAKLKKPKGGRKLTQQQRQQAAAYLSGGGSGGGRHTVSNEPLPD